MADRYERDSSSYDRALGFFDAVYGFSLTLLVTTIDVTGTATWESPYALISNNGGELLSFGISFIVIAVFWRNNHHMIGRLAALDGPTITANIVVMGLVVFIPFTTDAIGDPQLQQLALPTALYAVNVALCIIASVIMFQIAVSRGLTDNPVPKRVRKAQIIDGLSAPAVFLLSVPVTCWAVAIWQDSSAGKLFWLLLFITGPIIGRWSARIEAADTAVSADA